MSIVLTETRTEPTKVSQAKARNDSLEKQIAKEKFVVELLYESTENGIEHCEPFESVDELIERAPGVFGMTNHFQIRFIKKDQDSVQKLVDFLHNSANIVYRESFWLPEYNVEKIKGNITSGALIGVSGGFLTGAVIALVGSSAFVAAPLTLPLLGVSCATGAIIGSLIGLASGVLGGFLFSNIKSFITKKPKVEGKILKVTSLSSEFCDLEKELEENKKDQIHTKFVEFV